MKLTLCAVPFAVLAAIAAATRCQYSLRYCASSLRTLGYLEAHLQEVLAQEGCKRDQEPDHYLFRCTGDGRLAIDLREYSPTGGCVEQGLNKHDSFQTLGSPIVGGLCLKSEATQAKRKSSTPENKEKSCAKKTKSASRVFRGQDVLEVLVDM